MLRKLVVFAITSGLAAKAWRAYTAKKAVPAAGPRAASTGTARPAA